jgi:hypothetical protein
MSLGLIVVILAVALANALRKERRQQGTTGKAAQKLINEEGDGH